MRARHSSHDWGDQARAQIGFAKYSIAIAGRVSAPGLKSVTSNCVNGVGPGVDDQNRATRCGRKYGIVNGNLFGRPVGKVEQETRLATGSRIVDKD